MRSAYYVPLTCICRRYLPLELFHGMLHRVLFLLLMATESDSRIKYAPVGRRAVVICVTVISVNRTGKETNIVVDNNLSTQCVWHLRRELCSGFALQFHRNCKRSRIPSRSIEYLLKCARWNTWKEMYKYGLFRSPWKYRFPSRWEDSAGEREK